MISNGASVFREASFYSVTGNRVLVGAVLDLRQSRRMITKRLRVL